jgi:hypothetical protein
MRRRLRRRIEFPAAPRPRLSWSVLFGLAAFELMMWLWLAPSFQLWPFSPYDDARFDPAVWRVHAGDTAAGNPRGEMVADLQRRHLEPGMAQAAVEALLGPPDQREEYRWTYQLGHWNDYGIAPDTLVLGFDYVGGTLASSVVVAY